MKEIMINDNLFDLITEIMIKYNETHPETISEGDVVELLIRHDGCLQDILWDILAE